MVHLSRKKKQFQRLTLFIESIDLEGQGVAHHEQKVVFVHGAITGETVIAEVTQNKKNYSVAHTVHVLNSVFNRVEPPKCRFFGVCGGCTTQHIDPMTQVAVKGRALEDLMQRIGATRSNTIRMPITGPFWRYRHRARLSVRYVQKKHRMLIGFREKYSSFVVDMNSCEVLPQHVSMLLPKLSVFLSSLSIYEHIPQLELAVSTVATALVLRHLKPLSSDDLNLLDQFGQAHQVDWWLQPGGPSSVYPLHASFAQNLYYKIPSYGICMWFKPTDFTQINHQINDALIHTVVQCFKLSPTDKVLDLFCGIGNFSLPLATQCEFVLGVEGSDELVGRAHENAHLNHLSKKVRFMSQNLFDMNLDRWHALGIFEKVLIDPPRDGAQAVVKTIIALDQPAQPKIIVYVSCNPATLARDANILCNQGEYQLDSMGVINMFPHTGHVESIAVFKRCLVELS